MNVIDCDLEEKIGCEEFANKHICAIFLRNSEQNNRSTKKLRQCHLKVLFHYQSLKVKIKDGSAIHSHFQNLQ